MSSAYKSMFRDTSPMTTGFVLQLCIKVFFTSSMKKLKSKGSETVSQYCYLGIVMRYNGSFNLAISMEKARTAYFKIKKTVSLNNPARLIDKLFDCLISPILLYCSEIWGVFVP
jgi:hypothetical protein